jgi:cytochrome d ubiquinol oxidase subunit I
MDIEILSRIQFAFTIAFHYIYPPLSIGLGLFLVIFQGLYLKTKNKEYERLTRFWIHIFALTFGIGVATGIVMEFEFGTNWATYSRYVGDVFGSALAAEGIFAFALESGFLGLLLFGWNRVNPIMHFISTICVFLGSMFSAVWIVVANSWMQTPAGFHIVGEGIKARAEITDFSALVFNPSSIDRITHVWIAAFLSGAFLVLSIHAYYLIRDKHVSLSQKGLKIALVVATVFSISQLFSGHSSANGVAVNQPAKLAAFEGHFDSLAVADLYLFGWVDKEEKSVTGLSVPGGLSYLLYGNRETPIKGLDYFPKDEIPSTINSIFQFYHFMVAIGLSMILLTVYGFIQLIRKKLFKQKWLLWLFVFSTILPQLANQLGWFAAEMGRQPWVVYGLLKTSDALSAVVTANQVLASLIMFTFIYILLFGLFIFTLHRKIQKGPFNEEMIQQRPNQSTINEIVAGVVKR